MVNIIALLELVIDFSIGEMTCFSWSHDVYVEWVVVFMCFLSGILDHPLILSF